MEEKNKEMAKFLKKEKYSNTNEKILSSHVKKNKEIQKIISSIKSNKLYLYSIIFCSFVSIAICIVLYILWISYELIYNRIFYLIESHGNLSNNSYKIINYYQLMIYNSITLEDINNFEGFDTSKGEDFFGKLYRDLEDLYESRKYMQNLKDYNLDNIDEYFNHTCSSFYDQLYNTTESFIKSPISINFKSFFIETCEIGKVFKSINYKHIFSMLFEMIQLNMNKISDHSYRGLISHIRTYDYGKTIFIVLLVYSHTFNMLGSGIQRQSYQKISSLIDLYLHTGFLIYYIASIIFILIVIIVYINKLNRNYRHLHEMKKVFKICNKRE